MKLPYFLLVSLLSLSLLHAEAELKQTSYVYRSDTEGDVSDTTWVTEMKDDYIEIKGKNKEGSTLMECCPEDYTFDRFSYKSAIEPTQYEFVREGNILYIDADVNGKKTSLHHILKRNPWIQQLGFGLKGFAASKDKTYYFCILSQKDFALHDMVAKKEGIFPLKVGNKEYKAKKIHLTLAGFKSLFWSAEIWYDVATGDCILYKGDEGPSTPITVITLSAKKIISAPSSVSNTTSNDE